MNLLTNRQRAAWTAFALCIFFCAAGNLFIPRLGVENDEALFAQGLYQPRAELYSIHIGRSQIPIMLMSYLGALKCWVYGPVLRVFGVGIWSLREPTLLAGTASLALFFLLLRRVAGARAAAVGVAVLAVDAQYLLTATFDWGPVALQHLLLLGGTLLLIRFYQERFRERPFSPAAPSGGSRTRKASGETAHAVLMLAGGSVLLGLAMWDKALAVWMLSGLALGGLLTFPRQIAALATPCRLTVAALAFTLGALPLVIYNLEKTGATFRGNFQRDTRDVPGKALFLVNTFGGNGLFGWMTADDAGTPRPHAASGPVEHAAVKISTLAGHPRQSFLLYAFLLAIVLAPLGGTVNLRLVLWALIAMAVAWIQMAVNYSTGASIHHTILLWPLPQFVIAVSFAAASRRLGKAAVPALAAVVGILAVSGLLVINEYYCVLLRNGGGQSWNDGIFAASRYFDHPPRYDYAFAMDWGIEDPLRLLHRGRLRLASGTDQVSNPTLSPADEAELKQMVSNPANLFIAHTPEFEFFQGDNRKLLNYAAAAGYAPEVLARIADTRGRDVYEIYRFGPAAFKR